MTRDELDKLWQQALQTSVAAGEEFIRYHFAELVAAEERDKHDTGTHTCGNRCQRYACVAVREAVRAERAACARVCEEVIDRSVTDCAVTIRARGEPGP